MEISRREKTLDMIRGLREKLTSVIQFNESLFKKLKAYCLPHFGRKAKRPHRLAAADLEPLLLLPVNPLTSNGSMGQQSNSALSNKKKKRHVKEKSSNEKKLSSDEKLD